MIARGLLLSGAIALAGCGARSDLDVARPKPRPAVALAVGFAHGCALFEAGDAKCWGVDASGELGDAPSMKPRLTPIPLEQPTSIARLAAGSANTCAVLTSHELWCWGTNYVEQLGLGVVDSMVRPTKVASGITDVALGFSDMCALRDDGTPVCAGFAEHGELGNQETVSEVVLTPVAGASPAVAIGAGESMTCTITRDGSVECWGAGGLGDGQSHTSVVPVRVQGLPGPARALTLGSYHACVIIDDGSVYCWGDNASGELGVGAGVPSANAPLRVDGASPAIALRAQQYTTCAIGPDGSARCWGNVTGDTKGSYEPALVRGLPRAKAIAPGMQHACALLEDGRVMCWGWNAEGELGDGTTTPRDLPSDVVGLN